MSVYIDTSSIRKNSNSLEKFQESTTFTSALAVFELLSGINKKNFNMRKSIVKNLLDSSIYIDWETYKQKEYAAFNIQYDDVEGLVIKQMAEKIIECQSYEEYTGIKIYIDNHTYYTHESLEDFDARISEVGKYFSSVGKNEWRKLSKEERLKFKENMKQDNFWAQYICQLSDLSLMELAQDISGCKRPSEECFNTIQKYDQSLDLYLNYNMVFFLLCEMNGSECGHNDMIDILHLAYLKEDDTLVSEDKIFKKLNEKFQCLIIYDSKEYFGEKME